MVWVFALGLFDARPIPYTRVGGNPNRSSDPSRGRIWAPPRPGGCPVEHRCRAEHCSTEQQHVNPLGCNYLGPRARWPRLGPGSVAPGRSALTNRPELRRGNRPNRQGLAPPGTIARGWPHRPQSPGIGPTGHRNGPGAMQPPGPLVVVVGLSVDPIGPIAIIQPRQPLPPG